MSIQPANVVPEFRVVRNPVSLRRVILIGPHGAGKSTIGAMLASALGYQWLDEIGRKERERVLAANPGCDAMSRDPDFDARVIRQEIDRDRECLHNAVVETGLPGDLAYAKHRCGGVYPALLRSVSNYLVGTTRDREWIVVPLTMSVETARERLGEPGEPEAIIPFFFEVARTASELAQSFGWRVLAPIDTTSRTPGSAVREILRGIGVAAPAIEGVETPAKHRIVG